MFLAIPLYSQFGSNHQSYIETWKYLTLLVISDESPYCSSLTIPKPYEEKKSLIGNRAVKLIWEAVVLFVHFHYLGG